MDVASQTEKSFPPYTSFRTFRNHLDLMRQTGIPARLDSSVMSSMSGQVQSQLRSTYRFLNLIDADNVPNESLEQLVYAEGPAWQQQLRTILENSYSFIFGDESGNFDLAKATPQQLSDKFKETALNGDTVRKAETFFLNAVADAGIPISPHLKVRRASGTASRTSRSRNGQKARRKSPSQENASTNHQDVPTPPPSEPQRFRVQEAALQSLQTFLAKFPDFNPDWNEETQNRWLNMYDRVFNRLSTMARDLETGYNENEEG